MKIKFSSIVFIMVAMIVLITSILYVNINNLSPSNIRMGLVLIAGVTLLWFLLFMIVNTIATKMRDVIGYRYSLLIRAFIDLDTRPHRLTKPVFKSVNSVEGNGAWCSFTDKDGAIIYTYHFRYKRQATAFLDFLIDYGLIHNNKRESLVHCIETDPYLE